MNQNERLRALIASLRERADVLDGGKPIRTCSIHASSRADAFRQISAELEAALAENQGEQIIEIDENGNVHGNISGLKPAAPESGEEKK